MENFLHPSFHEGVLQCAFECNLRVSSMPNASSNSSESCHLRERKGTIFVFEQWLAVLYFHSVFLLGLLGPQMLAGRCLKIVGEVGSLMSAECAAS